MRLLLLVGRLRQGCGVFFFAYYLMRKSRRLLIPYWCPWGGFLWPPELGDLTNFGHLPEYPTCSKVVSWCGALCTVNFTGSIKPSFQYSSMPCRGFLLFGV